jgi:hypothetical protein
LGDLGDIDGQNITIEYRLAAADFNRLPMMAADLVQMPVDLIVTDGGDKVAKIARDATSTIPIVGGLGADPVAAGLVRSFAHPGGNVTGFATIGIELSGKRLQLLKETFPAISRVAALWNPALANPSTLRVSEEVARTLGLQLRRIDINGPDEIAAGFETATSGSAEALFVEADAMFWNERARIVALAAKYRMPAIYPEREYVDDGGLVVYHRRSACRLARSRRRCCRGLASGRHRLHRLKRWRPAAGSGRPRRKRRPRSVAGLKAKGLTADGGPKVRIHLPPAGSLQTIGSAWGRSSGAQIRHRARARPRLLGAPDARHLHQSIT